MSPYVGTLKSARLCTMNMYVVNVHVCVWLIWQMLAYYPE